MKKRNYKIFLAAMALSINTTLAISPLATTASVLEDNMVLASETSISEENPKITIGGVSAKGGETVKVPINISNLKNKGVSKFKIKVTFDPEVFKLSYSIMDSKTISNISGNVKTGEGYNYKDCTIDIGYDFNRASNIKALYEEGDYLYIPLTAANNVEDGISYLKIITEPILTDENGREYAGDSIIVDNKPITLKYNENIAKDSLLIQNYLKFGENNVKDTDIPMKKYENIVTTVQCSNGASEPINLNYGTDFILSDKAITLKESFLRTLVNKNAFITVNFNSGLSQTLFINNAEFNKSSNSKVSVETIAPENISNKSQFTIAITNTSNEDMDLGKLKYYFYYEKEDAHLIEGIKLNYSSIVGSNKDIRNKSYTTCLPLMCEGYYNTKCYVLQSYDNKAGALKPGETIVLNGHFSTMGEDTNRTVFQEPAVIYNGETVYGNFVK